MRRHASWTQAESVAQHRQPTSRAVLRPDPCSGSNARNAVNQAVLNVQSAIQVGTKCCPHAMQFTGNSKGPSSPGRCTRGLSLCNAHLPGLGLQGLRTASALMEAATSLAQSKAAAPAVPLQHQSSAVLGSGLLTYPPPAAQQHNPGPATDRSQRPRPALSELPRPTGTAHRKRQPPRLSGPLVLCQSHDPRQLTSWGSRWQGLWVASACILR